MKQYSKITPEDIELILWGDLKIMMESSTKENDQELKDGTIIHMLVERKYPLSKELLQQMLDLGLEVEEESTVALQLHWLVQKQTAFGKDKSNPLIVGSLLKTTKRVDYPRGNGYCYVDKEGKLKANQGCSRCQRNLKIRSRFDIVFGYILHKV
ncbi:hypothetical protein Tco_1031950 [Tanacetum coccineum]|uniref:Uncharacterized protein n=1 Tax=Tanacetum coccineum TaxID=301880 RepID=A0ABQ5GC55_9ASTR